MHWSNYVSSRAEGRNQEELAFRVGVSQSTISRWASGKGQPSAENVMTFARVVGDSPIVGLLMAGLVHEDEVDGVVRISEGLEAAETDALLTELGRRLGLHVTARKDRAG